LSNNTKGKKYKLKMRKIKILILIISFLLIVGFFYSRKNGEETFIDTPQGSTSITKVVTSRYKIAVIVTTNRKSITLRSNGTPDHVSPYWKSTNRLYEAQIDGHHTNPGKIGVQTYVMTIPTNPAEASSKEATSLGPIGMALNGVAIYNDREGGNVPVGAGVLKSFDRAGAHPGPGNTYHYHCTGDFTGNDNANLIGFLRDGFPIYARQDMDGTYPSDLDSNGGHTHATVDFPSGIYHYHASNIAYLNSRFYILKAGSYHGTKGTFTF
jgi:YHYH protein